jgi:ubiquinone/menaquinone biosynthesis C-methylase UbiE
MKQDMKDTISVCDYFDSGASFWRDIYEAGDVFAVIHQERRAAALSMVDNLHLPSRSEVLEIGCGAGLTSVALAQRGYLLEATDVAPTMLELTRKLVAQVGVDHLVHTRQCDAYNIPFEDNSFPLVLALGVLPWLPSLDEPMREMVRVVQPGGYLIVNTDNRLRLNNVLHPFAWARLAGLRVPDWLAFWRKKDISPIANMCFTRDFDSRLPGYGLEKCAGRTLGFGPFWGIARVLPRSVGVNLHRILQRLADRGIPPFRSTGSQYLTLLKKVT